MISALVVEDDPEFAQFLGYSLDQAGMNVTYCRGVPEALMQIMTKQFNYVLVDLMLPPLYSQEGLSILREVWSRQHSACVLLMTQRDEGTVSIVSEAMELGARYFFDKNDDLVMENIMAKIESVGIERRNGIFISHGHN
jgi:DNA-binding response OmpR family regulator